MSVVCELNLHHPDLRALGVMSCFSWGYLWRKAGGKGGEGLRMDLGFTCSVLAGHVRMTS